MIMGLVSGEICLLVYLLHAHTGVRTVHSMHGHGVISMAGAPALMQQRDDVLIISF